MRYFRLLLVSVLCAGLANARPGPDSNYNINVTAGGGGGGTTFNSMDASGVTLSNGNLTLVASGGSDGSARTNNNHSTGKFYFCGTIQVAIAGGDTALGIANGSTSLTGAPNSTLLVAAVYPGTGNIWVNGANVGGVGVSGSVNDVYDIAFDAGAQLIWVRRNNALWDNSGTDNPALGIGGFSTSGFAGAYYAWASSSGGTSETWTATFNGTCANTTPAGFGNF